ITLVAYVDTLCYLVKGGRVPRAVVWANTLIRIKPVFRIAPLSGEARVIRIARTRQGAIRQLLELVKRGAGGKAIHATVMHSGNLAEAQVLEQRLLTQVRCKETYVSDFSPAMGIHSGPGVLGIAFYGDDEPAR
ncbi:MAG: DegV family protein, partial [Dehalococcoidia bacterium]|nr:DegV family protein [Dehalococcoidia bacterium]